MHSISYAAPTVKGGHRGQTNRRHANPDGRAGGLRGARVLRGNHPTDRSSRWINEVTLFRRFGNKARLLRAALSAEIDELSKGGQVRHTGDLVEDLRRIVDVYRRLVVRHGRLIPVVLAELPRRPELQTVFEVPQRLLQSAAKIIETYQRAGALIEEPPLQATAGLLGPLLAGALLQQTVGLAPTMPDAHDHVQRYLRGRQLLPEP